MNHHQSNWIWTSQWGAEDKQQPALMLFRLELDLPDEPTQATIQISADSRYKLFVNGEMAEMGPSRGDRQIWFYDQVDLLPWLRKGRNALAVQVLRNPTEHAKGNHGIFRTEHPGLFVKGKITDCAGREYDLSAGWKCRKDQGFHIVSEAEGFAPLQIYEDCRGDDSLNGWMLPAFDDSTWQEAWRYPSMDRAVSPGNLQPRTIPYLYRKKRRFARVVVIRQSAKGVTAWENLLRQDCPLTIAPNSKEIVEITAGEEMTGYLQLDLAGGRGARIALLQSESYVQEECHGSLPVKGHREDWEKGHLEGFTDRYLAAGFGTEERPERYEPFWFRTFRFIRLEIETDDQPLTLQGFTYTETGYPLQVKTEVTTSDPDLAPIWENLGMDVLTLRWSQRKRCFREL